MTFHIFIPSESGLLGMTTSPCAQLVPFLIAQELLGTRETGLSVMIAAVCLVETVLSLLYHLLSDQPVCSSQDHTHNPSQTADDQA